MIYGGGGTCEAEVPDPRIVVSFSDNVPGNPDIDLAMKEGFRTASEQMREMGFGAGMGLPNIKKYTDDFQIQTVVGEGTTGTLYINL